ncbi:hypothetical protein E2C01_067423 [Portunus trituberculatus]|uniref:Uncharacterized protein n=1 Tax=Portunus trituberculatus TaxID=210409 RepID=A0A5B7HTK4_PORTR|nr:hypothetical protein [Portunus trituberculatus]
MKRIGVGRKHQQGQRGAQRVGSPYLPHPRRIGKARVLLLEDGTPVREPHAGGAAEAVLGTIR